MTSLILAAAAAYLLRSIPFAFLLARRRGIDVRRAGSGDVGASNVLRTTGVSGDFRRVGERGSDARLPLR